MQIILINPPFSEPLVPPPALAALAESLASAADVAAYDLNLEMFNLLFDSALDGKTGSGEDKPRPVSFGAQYRAAFQDGIPSILKMKQLEHDIQDTLNSDSEGRFKVWRGSLVPCSIYPASVLSSTLSQFSESVFGKALASSVTKILPSVEGAGCVALSSMLPTQTIPGLMVAQLLRRAGYEGVIVLGGMLPTYTHEYLVTLALVQELIDFVFVGEFPVRSEEFVKYCESLSRTERTGRSLSVLHSGHFEPTGAVHVPPELTSNGEGYRYLPLGDYWGAEPVIHLAATKGCYWGKCSFCAMRRIYGGRALECGYVRNSPEQAVQRMISFQEKLGVSALDLETDVIDPRTLVEIARGLAKRGARLTWFAITRFENGFTRRVLEELFEGGCRRLFFGFETASPRMQQLMGKGIHLHTVKRILRDCVDIGIAAEIGLFFGFPGEEDKDALMTVDFVAENSDLIHRCDADVFECLRISPVGMAPEKYGIEIVEPAGQWYNLVWKDLTGATLKDPHYYRERVRAIQPDRLLLDVSEDVWLVCKHGVRAVEEQLRESVNHR